MRKLLTIVFLLLCYKKVVTIFWLRTSTHSTLLSSLTQIGETFTIDSQTKVSTSFSRSTLCASLLEFCSFYFLSETKNRVHMATNGWLMRFYYCFPAAYTFQLRCFKAALNEYKKKEHLTVEYHRRFLYKIWNNFLETFHQLKVLLVNFRGNRSFGSILKH